MSEDYTQRLAFSVSGFPDDLFTVFRVDGEESISQLFRFDVQMVADTPDIRLGELIGDEAVLTLERNQQTRKIHGIVTWAAQEGMTRTGRYIFRARLEPRLVRLDMSRQNQIYGTTDDASIVEVIEAELTANAKGGPADAVAGRLGPTDFDLRLTQQYPKRDYVVQYGESDLSFVSRLAETAGIFYFFQHDEGRDKVVFGDSNVAFVTMPGGSSLAYRPDSGLLAFDEAAVASFSCAATPLPKKLYLRDYNYRLPHLSLLAEADVDPNGHGVVVEYGAHFKSPDEGARLAQIRAKEILCRKFIFSGRSDCLNQSPGMIFDLTDHFRDDFNQSYIFLTVTHTATQTIPGVTDGDLGAGGGTAQTGYAAEFTCIPKTVEFRPERRTPKPIMPGLANAHVDAASGGNRAEIDEEGRYKVRTSFDLRGESDGKASRYVRKVEPYGGADSGMHFPLLKGTEVVMGCVNGDPDRPIILGAVPNPRNQSVVTSANSTKNRIRTTSGITFEMEDGSSSGGSSSGASGAALAPQRLMEGGKRSPRTETAPPKNGTESLEEQRFMSDVSETGDNYARLSVPNTDYTSYMRLGQSDTSTESGYSSSDLGSTEGGLMFYTAKDSNSWVVGSAYSKVDTTRRGSTTNHYDVSTSETGLFSKKISLHASSSSPSHMATISAKDGFSDGDIQLVTDNNLIEYVGGEIKQTIASDETVNVMGDSYELTVGQSWEIFIGTTSEISVSASSSIAASASLDISVGISTEISLGLSLSLSIGGEVEFSIMKSASDALVMTAEGVKLESTVTKAEADAAKAEAASAAAEMTSLQGKVNSLEGKVGNLTADVEALIFKP